MEDVPSNSELLEISTLADRQLKWQALVETIEKQLKEAEAELRQVREVDLPNAMLQAGVSEIKLPTGQKISIKEDIYASIPKDDRYHEAIDWLKEHGFGDVIKNKVEVLFGKGEEDQARALMMELNSNGWKTYTNSETVHSSTLKALIREQLAKGADFPLELFGAMPVTKAVIK
jgi:hypothetical protein